MSRPLSIPDRFVTTWAVVQMMPDDLYAIACLKEEAEQVIADALRRADRIADAATLLRKAINEAAQAAPSPTVHSRDVGVDRE